MRHLLWTLAVLGVGFSAMAAGAVGEEDFTYQLLRTDEVPGYFLLRVLPAEGLKPLEQLLTHYVVSAEEEEIRTLLEEQGASILSPTQALALQGRFRLVAVGLPELTHPSALVLHSMPRGEARDFLAYQQQYLGPVVAEDVAVEFLPGNVHDVYSWGGDMLSSSGAMYLGAFDFAAPEVVTLRGFTAEGGALTRLELPLDQPLPVDETLHYGIADFWEAVHQASTTTPALSNRGETSPEVVLVPELPVTPAPVVETVDTPVVTGEAPMLSMTANPLVPFWQRAQSMLGSFFTARWTPYLVGAGGILLLLWNVRYLLYKRREAIVWQETAPDEKTLDAMLRTLGDSRSSATEEA